MWKFYIFYTSVITCVLVNTILGHEACPKFSPGPLTLGSLHFGIDMKASCFRSFYGVSITECATECLLRKSRCKSINYWRVSLKCQLCENTAAVDNMEPSNGGVHSDISTWSESFASSCAEKKCGHLERCMPDKAADSSNEDFCDVSECPLPEGKPGAAIEQETGVGVTLRYTCINKRLKRTGNPSSTCQSDGNWTISDFACDPWELVFQITPGVGGDVYEAWKSDRPYTTNSDVNCQTLRTDPSCQRHFRSPVLDRWSAEVKSIVKVGIYTDGKEVHNITFNANGSDMWSWFSNNRVLNTTYKGILHTKEFNFFSIIGITGKNHLRRFYISRNFDTCEKDFGWMMVIVTSTEYPCKYDNATKLPAIVYVENPEGEIINNAWRIADALGVFIYHQL